MARRSTRKKIIYQIDGIAKDLDHAANRTVDILKLSGGRPEQITVHCHALVGALGEIIKVVDGMRKLYRGAPGEQVPTVESPEVLDTD